MSSSVQPASHQESIEPNRDIGEFAIEAKSLSKCYRIYNHPRDRLRQSIWPRNITGQRVKLFREFWALHPLSFSLKRGQTLGVMGRNGSGKSTLLQLLCGTLTPSSGAVHCSGRIGALLELGSGFNPDFSGIENIHLNAALLGLTKKEIEAQLDNILSFADIGDFVDQPVKTYSSGMVVRLAFAVQAHVNPDLLVVDEALAVGDELFQKKCYRHLEKLKENGTAILLVTHSCPQILQHCDEALLLHKGRARLHGRPPAVTVTYQRLINASDEEWDATLPKKTSNQNTESPLTVSPSDQDQQNIALVSSPQQPTSNQSSAHPSKTTRPSSGWFDENLIPSTTERFESKGARIEDVWIENSQGKKCNTLPFGEPFQIIFSYRASETLNNIGFACHIANHTGLRITGQSHPPCLTSASDQDLIHPKANDYWTITYAFHGGLWPGTYVIGGGILHCREEPHDFIDRVIDFRALRILDQPSSTVVGAAALQASETLLRLTASGEALRQSSL